VELTQGPARRTRWSIYWVYDSDSKQTTRVDVQTASRRGPHVGYYVYAVRGPDARSCSSIPHEPPPERDGIHPPLIPPRQDAVTFIRRGARKLTGNRPEMRYLADDNRFLGSPNGTAPQPYLYDLSGKRLATLTDHPFEVANIVSVDRSGRDLLHGARPATPL